MAEPTRANPLAVPISAKSDGTVTIVCEFDRTTRTVARGGAVDPRFDAAYRSNDPGQLAEAAAKFVRYPAQLITCPTCGREMKTEADWEELARQVAASESPLQAQPRRARR